MTEVHAEFPLVEIALIILIAALAGLGLMRLKQPPLVGYILAGVVLGPTGFSLIGSNENVTSLAEMGVLVLLFFIGTELSIKAFVATLRPALIVAAGQMVAAMAIGAGIIVVANATLAEGLILGFILALSSTVVAMKMLDDIGALRRLPGRITVGVLIAQDIAVVPMLILISSFGGEAELDWGQLTLKIALAVVLLGGLLWWLGRSTKIRFPFDAQIGGSVEILALVSLAVCFGAAALSGLTGLSPAYGAFVAGLVIGNSSLRNRVIPVIEPIQSILLVIFFLSIGLLIDLNYIRENIGVVLAASVFVIATKTLLNIFLLRLSGFDRETALLGGLSMAQIGEFSFVLAATGFTAGALGYDIYRLAITVTAITLLFSPAWMALMRRVEELATEDYASYREALAEAYAEELDSVQKSWWWVRVRYRSWRVVQKRKRRNQPDKDAKTPTATQQDVAEAASTPTDAPHPARPPRSVVQATETPAPKRKKSKPRSAAKSVAKSAAKSAAKSVTKKPAAKSRVPTPKKA